MGVNFEPDSVIGSAMGRNQIELDQEFTDLINAISVFRKDLMKVASVAQTDLDMKFGFKSPSVETAGDIASERCPHAATATPAISPPTSSYITSDDNQLINPPVLRKVLYAEKDSEDRHSCSPFVSNRELPCCRHIDSNFPSELSMFQDCPQTGGKSRPESVCGRSEAMFAESTNTDTLSTSSSPSSDCHSVRPSVDWPELKNCDPTPDMNQMVYHHLICPVVVLMTINYHFTTMEMCVRPRWDLVISPAHCIHCTVA